jgi:hypothetical protein
MKFDNYESSKRQRFARISRTIKYNILKEQDADERGKAQMKHKPYTCDMKCAKQKEGN